MKLTLAFLLAALPAFCQAPSAECKASLLGSANMKGIYGGRTSVYQANINCLNLTSGPVVITGVALDLSMATLNTMPSATAQALLTKTYNNQPGQVAGRDMTLGIGVLGVLEASKGLAFLAAGPFGLAVAAVVGAVQYVIPFFTQNEVPLSFGQPCDQVTSGTMIAAGASLTCTAWIQKPPKGAAPLPGAFTFVLVNASNYPVPGPLPPPAPVQLRPQASFKPFHIDPSALPTLTMPDQAVLTAPDVAMTVSAPVLPAESAKTFFYGISSSPLGDSGRVGVPPGVDTSMAALEPAKTAGGGVHTEAPSPYLQLVALDDHRAEAYAATLRAKGLHPISLPIEEKPGVSRVLVPAGERAQLSSIGIDASKTLARMVGTREDVVRRVMAARAA